MRWLFMLSVLGACDDSTFVAPVTYGSDWDGTRELLVRHCADCHPSGGALLSDDDVRAGRVSLPDAIITDLCEELGTYVVPGDQSESMLWRIVSDTRAPYDPPAMPSGRSRLTADQLADLSAWIRTGAPVKCDDPSASDTGDPR